MSKTYAVVRVESGILGGVTLFEDRDEALRFGRDEFERATYVMVRVNNGGPNPWCHAQTNDPDFDEEWGGVARGFVMHWETTDVDIWMTEPNITVEQLTSIVGREGTGRTTAGGGDRPLCPFCRDGAIDGERYEAIVGQLGRGTIEAVLESIDPPHEEEEETRG